MGVSGVNFFRSCFDYRFYKLFSDRHFNYNQPWNPAESAKRNCVYGKAPPSSSGPAICAQVQDPLKEPIWRRRKDHVTCVVWTALIWHCTHCAPLSTKRTSASTGERLMSQQHSSEDQSSVSQMSGDSKGLQVPGIWKATTRTCNVPAIHWKRTCCQKNYCRIVFGLYTWF